MTRKTVSILLIVLVVLAIVVYTQLTIFVIQPIGAIPEGKTLVILRLNKTEFIDSADAMCEREMGGVSLLCRMGMMGGVASKSTVLLRLPYSQALYDISTGGKSYDR
ncbi:hypothetical protein [Stenotrophomonas forensis]|uniref:Uncharacterized protein n=1 Tax=Stenotrophomonas forensis TaxID=2871169 RepID=A0ABY7Y5Q5_9GAMM|nr:hypothetical protein [Stenotrophomonas sp. DFS-20110405]WDM65303.1 hypothetical protein K5L94_08530 [Stenotrophomonas sp. DFS-20110405]